MNSWDNYFRKGYDGLIIIRDGKYCGGITYPRDATKEEWKIVKRGINHSIKTINQLQELEKRKPKDAHIKDFKAQLLVPTHWYSPRKIYY